MLLLGWKMVRQIIESGKTFYVCEECGLGYAKKELAEKCEAWCKEHKSCNLEIASHAVKFSCKSE